MFKFRPIAYVCVACAALAIALPAAAGTLSPQLQALASAYHKAPKATVAQAVRVTNGAAVPFFSPHVNAAGQVQVYIHYRPGSPPSQAALAGLGASGVLVSRPLGVVQAWVPIAKLHAAAALAGAERVGLPVYGHAVGAAAAQPAADTCSGVPSGLKIDNEGIAAENVGPVHKAGIKGAGVKVGIVSNGVDCIADSQAQGYLPTDVFVDPTLSGSGDEGTAMLEEVHAIAPDAMLGFCGPATTADLFQCFDDLATWGADIISDDLYVYYSLIPQTYQQIEQAVDAFAAEHPDLSGVAAVGNDQQDYFQHTYIADSSPNIISLAPSYTAGPGQVGGRTYKSAMNFGAAVGQGSDTTTATEPLKIASGFALNAVLSWNDPAGGPYDDLDLFLVDENGKVIASSTYDQTTGPSPDIGDGEALSYKNTTGSVQTLYLAALCFQCDHPILVKLSGFMDNAGAFKYITNGSVYGHATLAAEIGAAAACYDQNGSSIVYSCKNRTDTKSTLEYYSGVGPFTFGDWSSGTHTRAKPDITGTDCTTVSGAGGFGSPFCGTSAASPNVAAVIALMRGYAPNAATSAAGWKSLVMKYANPSALTNYTLNAGGVGLVDAAAAVSALKPSSITATITSPSASPFKVDPNTPIPFQATCKYGGKQTPSYHWSFGKPGSNAPPDATGLAPEPVQYANGGIYTVTFTCTVGKKSDSDNATAEVQAAATAEDQSLDTAHNKPVTGQFKGTGVGGEQLSAVIVSGPSHGKLTVNQDQFTYTPNKGFSGKDSFQFQIDNGVEKSNTATVTITVAKGSPPVAHDGTLTTKENESASGTLSATDSDGDPLTFSIVSQPSHGTVSLTNASTGAYTYTPGKGYSGSDSFTFKASADGVDSNTATVSITVKKVSSGGGGGAFGGLGLGLLAGLSGLLLFWRRRR